MPARRQNNDVARHELGGEQLDLALTTHGHGMPHNKPSKRLSAHQLTELQGHWTRLGKPIRGLTLHVACRKPKADKPERG